MPLYRRMPKRGFSNPFKKEYATINLGKIQNAINSGKFDINQPITQERLVLENLVKLKKDGIKLLANGNFSEKLNIKVAKASKAAIASVENNGGSVTILPQKERKDGKGKGRDKRSANKKAAIAKKLEELKDNN